MSDSVLRRRLGRNPSAASVAAVGRDVEEDGAAAGCCCVNANVEVEEEEVDDDDDDSDDVDDVE